MTLLPCPFCGGTAEIKLFQQDNPCFEYVVVCSGCDVKISGTGSKVRNKARYIAIAAWNRRAPVKGASHE